MSYQPIGSQMAAKSNSAVRAKVEDEVDEEGSPRTPWGSRTALFPKSLGWKSQSSMVGLFILAFLIAVANYCFFWYLDGRAVDDIALSQSYIGAASVSLAFMFKACLVTSIWSAFAQWLWCLLRQKEAKVSTIEDLSMMLYNSTSLLSWQAFLFHPLLYLCAVLSWSVGISTIFPPGALIVRSQASYFQQNAIIPVFDPTYRGDGTMRDLQSYALFGTSGIGKYFDPKPSVARLAKQTILQHQPLSPVSPCGQNCSYVVQIPGPSYRCSPMLPNPSNMPTIHGGVDVFFAKRVTTDQVFSFEAEWYAQSSFGAEDNAEEKVNQSPLQTISCDAWASIYTVDVRYANGVPTFRSSVHEIGPLPAAALADGALFSPNATRFANGTLDLELYGDGSPFLKRQSLAATDKTLLILTALYSAGWGVLTPAAQSFVWNDSVILPPGLQNISTAFELSNIRAIHDAISESLAGVGSALTQEELTNIQAVLQDNIDCSFQIFGDGGTTTKNSTCSRGSQLENATSSLILESSMAAFSSRDSTAVNLTITAESLNELLQNTTISLLSMPNTNRSILVTTTNDRNFYVFARPINLILPYAVSLVLSSVFVAIGLRSLYANGTPADVGGFLQTLRATRGSRALDQMAVEASKEGSTQESRRALHNLRVRLGRLHAPGEGGGATVVGFGTALELASTPGIRD